MSRGTMPGRRRSTGLQSFVLRRPSDVDIILDDEDEHSFVSSYTTLDTISGQVLIKCAKDTTFHDLEISFEGITETCRYPPTSKSSRTEFRFTRPSSHCIWLMNIVLRHREGRDNGSHIWKNDFET
jgi:hypothetical protein